MGLEQLQLWALGACVGWKAINSPGSWTAQQQLLLERQAQQCLPSWDVNSIAGC